MSFVGRLLATSKKPDALSYELPEELRVQIARIWEKGFGPYDRFNPGANMAYRQIHDSVCDRHGLFSLPHFSRSLPLEGIIAEYFVSLTDVPKALHVVEIVFGTMEKMVGRTPMPWGFDAFHSSALGPMRAIEHLNQRFREAGVGYQYADGQIVTIDSGPPPMPLKERLVAGQRATNLRKIKDLIGDSTVIAIHDPYTTTGSLDTMLKLADMGAKFSPSLRILGTDRPLSKSTDKKAFLGLLHDINTERGASWQVRIYPPATKPHRRFLVLDDGSVVTCGMSLNHIDKDEVLDHEPSGSENAKHDHQLFEAKWKIGTPI